MSDGQCALEMVPSEHVDGEESPRRYLMGSIANINASVAVPFPASHIWFDGVGIRRIFAFVQAGSHRDRYKWQFRAMSMPLQVQCHSNLHSLMFHCLRAVSLPGIV